MRTSSRRTIAGSTRNKMRQQERIVTAVASAPGSSCCSPCLKRVLTLLCILNPNLNPIIEVRVINAVPWCISWSERLSQAKTLDGVQGLVPPAFAWRFRRRSFCRDSPNATSTVEVDPGFRISMQQLHISLQEDDGDMGGHNVARKLEVDLHGH